MAEHTPKLNTFSESLDLERRKSNLIGGLFTVWSIKRLRWGMLILLLIAPFSKFAYLLFPEKGFGKYLVDIGPIQIINTIEGVGYGWYFVYISNYLWSIGELMAPTLIILGVFLLFPKNNYISYLLGLPFGYYLSLLIHRMFFVIDYQSFHDSFPLSTMLLFLVFGIVLFYYIDKRSFSNKNNKVSFNNRIQSIITRKDISWNEKESVLRQEVRDSMKIENETYTRN